MLDQDESRYEGDVPSEGQNPQESADTPQIDQQVRETVEVLKLKLENLRLFLSWRK
jgi:hypothetical protein